MAAAYQTGTATGVVDLLQKLVTFLGTQGWTSNLSAADGSGWRAHVSKSGVFANFRAYTNADTNSNIWSTSTSPQATKAGIAMYLGDGFSGAVNWRDQSGGPVGSGTSTRIGSSAYFVNDTVSEYHFFDDGQDNIVVAAQSTAGAWVYLVFGLTVKKVGSWTGGPYFATSGVSYFLSANGVAQAGWTNPAFPPFSRDVADVLQSSGAFLRIDVDAFTSDWASTGSSSNALQSGHAGVFASGDISGSAPGLLPPAEIPSYTSLLPNTGNAFNGRSVLLPIHCYVGRQGGGWSLVAEIPNLFIGYGDFAGGSIYSIGSDDYFVVPTKTARFFWFVRKWA